MRRAARWLGFIARLTSGVVTAALLIVVFVFGWLGLTTGGLRAAVALADDIAGETFDVASVDGRLLGTLELGGIRIATPGATVTVERFRFGWIPGWLPEMSFFVRTLEAEGVTVALHETEPAPPDDSPAAPLDVLIPLRVTLADMRITDLRVTRDDATLAVTAGIPTAPAFRSTMPSCARAVRMAAAKGDLGRLLHAGRSGLSGRSRRPKCQ